MHVLWIWNEDSERWEGINGKNEMRFLNHAQRTQCRLVGHRPVCHPPIAKDEEITFDYGWDDEDNEDGDS